LDGPLTAWSEAAGDVGILNVSDGTLWRSAGVAGPYYPDVSGHFVAYQGNVNGNWDIYVYDSTLNTSFDATTNTASQENPALSSTQNANLMVYQDNRHGNWDIYITGFWYGVGAAFPTAPPITPSKVLNDLEAVKNRIADLSTSDFAGANDKVKENRRNALINQLDSAIADVEAVVNTQNVKLQSKYFQSAIDQLNGMVGKLDGWSSERGADVPGSGFTPDWISAPVFLDQTVKSCSNDLQTLLNSIS
jgi:hypothetical protein